MLNDDLPPDPPGPSGPVDDDAPTVVGVGASAGGLAALKAFFAEVPADSGLAWVVVVHLSPEHESHLAELLQAHVQMPIQQVTETVPLETDRVYVIPPNANLSTIDTHLRLSELEARRQERAPIDHFFRTLARSHDGHAVGVILTGTGSDGTLGIREIKEKGGFTVVQDPGEAEYDGMPQSAIATGLVDAVLPLAKIPHAVLGFARTRPRVRVSEEEPDEGAKEEGRLLQKVFARIRAGTGRDFARYKRSTILRRIARRMQIRRIEELDHYLELLRGEADEARALADDLLITVTSFFRDPEVFEALEQEVIPGLLEGRGADDTVRVWSVGCATGEEAYSLAILLLEAAARQDAPPRIQVFASDLHEKSLAKARHGFYPGDIATDVTSARLKRFFTEEDGGYRIRSEVRDLVVFSPHNLLGDPPFSRVDLISCRNVLIYLDREVQRDVVDLFHYALRGEGSLVLGGSESVETQELFQVRDKKHRIYRRRNVPGPEPRLPVFPLARAREAVEVRGAVEAGPQTYGKLHERIVERFGPASILVSPDDRVVHLSEHAGRYLVHAGGEPTTNAYKLVREELRIELSSALQQTRKRQAPVQTRPRMVRFNGESAEVVMDVRPALEPEQEGYVVVLFSERESGAGRAGEEEAVEGAPQGAAGGDGGSREETPAAELEAELRQSRERLQSIIEQYETTQEELRASNEELQSSNEELRSTMEELETSKEELQSINEELQTVNQENRHKVDELSQVSADLQNLMAATGIATLFLDREGRIMRYTPPVAELFNVRPADRGRPVADLTHRLEYDELEQDAARVLDRLTPLEREIRDVEDRWYLTRVLPYRSREDRIKGVVVTFVDITARKHAEEELRRERHYAESIVETLHEPLLVLEPDLRVRTANQTFYDHFEVRERETIGSLIYDLGNGQWDIPELRTLLEDVLPDSEVFNDYEVRHEFEGIGQRVMLLNARRLDHVQMILLGIQDITDRKRAEEAVRKSEAHQALLLKLTDALRPLADPVDIQGTAARILGEYLGNDRAYYVELDEPNDEYVVARDWHQPGAPSHARRYPLPDWPMPWLIDGRTWVVRDTDTDPAMPDDQREAYRGNDIGAAVVVPLIKDDRLVATFATNQRAPRDWTPQEVALVEATAERTWAAVERARAEADRMEAEERYLALFNALDQGFCTIEVAYDEDDRPIDFGFLEVSPSFEQQTGVENAEGRWMREIAPDQDEVWFERYGRVARDRHPDRFEAHSTPLGRWWSVYAFPVGEPEERRIGVLFSDVTARKQADEALRESEARFRAVADLVPDFLWEADRRGHRVWGNQRWMEYTGQTPEEATDHGWTEKIHPEDRDAALDAYETAIEAGDPYRHEYRIRRADGAYRWFLVRAVPVRDEGGEVREWIGSDTDVHEHREFMNTLEGRVAERTQEVRDLAETLSMAEQEERQRLSHLLHDDLQQLLYSVQMKIAVARDHAQREDLEGVVAYAERSLKLLGDAITRTQQLTVNLNPPILEGEGLVGAIEWLRTQMRDLHGLTVEIHAQQEIDVRPPDLQILLFQITRELLFNVAKHAETDRAVVSVGGEDGRVRVTVADEGKGFDLGVIGTGVPRRGGLGLFSAQERLRMRGGDLEIESAPGDGTRVVAYAPLASGS